MTTAVPSYEAIVGKARQQLNEGVLKDLFSASKVKRMVRAAVADGGSSVFDMLNNNQKAPAATTVVAVPVKGDPSGGGQVSVSDNDMQHLRDLQLLETYVSAAAAAIMYQANPAGWRVSDPAQAADFIRKQADARYRVFTQGLAAVCPIETNVAANFKKDTTSADIHLDFLTGLFSSFSFSPSTMKELDGVMTNVTNALRNLQVSWSDQSQTLDHLLAVYFFEPVQGLEAVHTPKLRLFFLHIDQRSWTLSIGKSSIEHFEFNMNFNDAIGALNTEQMALDRAALQQYVNNLDAANQEAIQKLASPKAVHDSTVDSRA